MGHGLDDDAAFSEVDSMGERDEADEPAVGDARSPTARSSNAEGGLPSGWSIVVLLCLALAVSGLILVVGTASLSPPTQFAHALRTLDDGVITFDELPGGDDGAADEAGAVSARRNDCSIAIDNYVAVAKTELRPSSPSRIRVPNYTDPEAERRSTCTVIEERRLAETGTSVLIVAVLGGVSTLIAAVAWPGVRRVTNRERMLPATVLALVVIGLSLGLAGQYRGEGHLAIALTIVFAAIALLFAELMELGRATVSERTRFSQEVDDLRMLRYRTRFAVGALSVILSVSVALAASLNARYLATEGRARVNLPGVDLGGFGQEHLGLITAIQGIMYATILAAVSLPALFNTERQGHRVLVRSLESSDEVVDQSAPAQRVRAAVEREEIAEKLGLRTRPVQWFERATALLLPLITGVSADFLGLLS